MTTWDLPPEPGPEVTTVRDRDGDTWERDGKGIWRVTTPLPPGHVYYPPITPWRTWRHLLQDYGPLTDATEVQR
jgi:hypothetical protein